MLLGDDQVYMIMGDHDQGSGVLLAGAVQVPLKSPESPNVSVKVGQPPQFPQNLFANHTGLHSYVC